MVTYSTALRLSLPGTGELSGTWGDTTNTNLGTLIEQAITGVLAKSLSLESSPYSLTASNGATDESRNMLLNFTGTAAANFTITLQPVNKLYFVQNNATNPLIFSSPSATSTITVPVGATAVLRVEGNGTTGNVYRALANVGVTGKTANYTVVASDAGNVIDCTANTFTVTLLPAATATNGFPLSVANSGTGTITVDGNSSETIDGFATIYLLPGQAVALICDGSNWKIQSGSYRIRQSVAWQGVGLTARTTNGPGTFTVETATNKIMLKGLSFDASTIEYGQLGFILPSSINTSAPDFAAAFGWTHPATTTNFGVVWAAQMRVFADADNYDQAFGTAQEVADTGGNTSYCYLSAATSTITSAGTVAGGSKLIVQLYRNATSGSDTLAVDAYLTDVLLEMNCIKSGNDA